MTFQVEEDGIVHEAFGVLGDDLRRMKKTDMLVFTGYACDRVAWGRKTPVRLVSSGRTVTCFLCASGMKEEKR